MKSKEFKKPDARSSRNRMFKPMVSLVTAMAFLVNTLIYDTGWAVPASPASHQMPEVSTAVDSHIDGIISHIGAFTLPATLGEIKSREHFPDSPYTVFHIQDAHANYDCQKSIAGIISHIENEYGVKTVNLEGGSGEYDLSVFTRINDADIRRRVADYFVREGILNGAEYFYVNEPGKSYLWGIEDVDLYISNLEAYRGSLRHSDSIDRALRSLSENLDQIKKTVYSAELYEIDGKFASYRRGDVDLRDHLIFLSEKARSEGLQLKAYPNLYLLSHSLELEHNIDFRAANTQRSILIDELSRLIPISMLETLTVRTIEFRSGSISQTEFYEFLGFLARRVGLPLSDFPELEKFMVYISLYDAVDKSSVISEISALEEAIQECFFQNEAQKELAAHSKNMTVLENMFAIKLTREDHEYYRQHEDDFTAENFTAFIKREAPRGIKEIRLASETAELDARRGEISGFYEYSFKRDKVFLENIKFDDPDKDNNRKYAMLVTGGFHSENLYDLFREKRISYVSVMPGFRNKDTYENPYFRLLSGHHTGIMAKLSGSSDAMSSALALYSYFCETSGLVKGQENVESANAWVELVTAVFERDLSSGPVSVGGMYIVETVPENIIVPNDGMVLRVGDLNVLVTLSSEYEESVYEKSSQSGSDRFEEKMILSPHWVPAYLDRAWESLEIGIMRLLRFIGVPEETLLHYYRPVFVSRFTKIIDEKEKNIEQALGDNPFRRMEKIGKMTDLIEKKNAVEPRDMKLLVFALSDLDARVFEKAAGALHFLFDEMALEKDFASLKEIFDLVIHDVKVFSRDEESQKYRLGVIRDIMEKIPDISPPKPQLADSNILRMSPFVTGIISIALGMSVLMAWIGLIVYYGWPMFTKSRTVGVDYEVGVSKEEIIQKDREIEHTRMHPVFYQDVKDDGSFNSAMEVLEILIRERSESTRSWKTLSYLERMTAILEDGDVMSRFEELVDLMKKTGFIDLSTKEWIMNSPTKERSIRTAVLHYDIMNYFMLYHGTSMLNLHSIRENGLDPDFKCFDADEIEMFNDVYERSIGISVPLPNNHRKMVTNFTYGYMDAQNGFAILGSEVLRMTLREARSLLDLDDSSEGVLLSDDRSFVEDLVRKYEEWFSRHEPLLLAVRLKDIFATGETTGFMENISSPKKLDEIMSRMDVKSAEEMIIFLETDTNDLYHKGIVPADSIFVAQIDGADIKGFTRLADFSHAGPLESAETSILSGILEFFPITKAFLKDLVGREGSKEFIDKHGEMTEKARTQRGFGMKFIKTSSFVFMALLPTAAYFVGWVINPIGLGVVLPILGFAFGNITSHAFYNFIALSYNYLTSDLDARDTLYSRMISKMISKFGENIALLMVASKKGFYVGGEKTDLIRQIGIGSKKLKRGEFHEMKKDSKMAKDMPDIFFEDRLKVRFHILDPDEHDGFFFNAGGSRNLVLRDDNSIEGFLDLYVTREVAELFSINNPENLDTLMALIAYWAVSKGHGLKDSSGALWAIKNSEHRDAMLRLMKFMIDRMTRKELKEIISKYEKTSDSDADERDWETYEDDKKFNEPGGFEFQLYDYCKKKYDQKDVHISTDLIDQRQETIIEVRDGSDYASIRYKGIRAPLELFGAGDWVSVLNKKGQRADDVKSKVLKPAKQKLAELKEQWEMGGQNYDHEKLANFLRIERTDDGWYSIKISDWFRWETIYHPTTEIDRSAWSIADRVARYTFSNFIEGYQKNDNKVLREIIEDLGFVIDDERVEVVRRYLSLKQSYPGQDTYFFSRVRLHEAAVLSDEVDPEHADDYMSKAIEALMVGRDKKSQVLLKDKATKLLKALAKQYRRGGTPGVSVAEKIARSIAESGIEPEFWNMFEEVNMTLYHEKFPDFYKEFLASGKPRNRNSIREAFIKYLGTKTYYRAVRAKSDKAYKEKLKKGLVPRYISDLPDGQKSKGVAKLILKYGLPAVAWSAIAREDLPGQELEREDRYIAAPLLSVSSLEGYALGIARAYAVADEGFLDEDERIHVYEMEIPQFFTVPAYSHPNVGISSPGSLIHAYKDLNGKVRKIRSNSPLTESLVFGKISPEWIKKVTSHPIGGIGEYSLYWTVDPEMYDQFDPEIKKRSDGPSTKNPKVLYGNQEPFRPAVTNWLYKVTEKWPDGLRAIFAAPVIEEILYRGIPLLITSALAVIFTGGFDWGSVSSWMIIPQFFSAVKFVLGHYSGERGPPEIFGKLFAPSIVSVFNVSLLPFLVTNPVSYMVFTVLAHAAVNSGLLILNYSTQVLGIDLRLGLAEAVREKSPPSIWDGSRDTFSLDSDFTQIGSVGAGIDGVVSHSVLQIYECVQTGEKFLLKRTEDIHHMRNELIAQKIFEKAGIRVPRVKVATIDSQKFLMLEFLEGYDVVKGDDISEETVKNDGKFKEGALLDLLIYNYDRTGWNIMKKGNNIAFIDFGGSLFSRSSEKDGYKGFFPEVSEDQIEAVAVKGKNSVYSRVFNLQDTEGLITAYLALGGIKDSDIDDIIDEAYRDLPGGIMPIVPESKKPIFSKGLGTTLENPYPMFENISKEWGGDEAGYLKHTLKERRNVLLEKYKDAIALAIQNKLDNVFLKQVPVSSVPSVKDIISEITPFPRIEVIGKSIAPGSKTHTSPPHNGMDVTSEYDFARKYSPGNELMSSEEIILAMEMEAERLSEVFKENPKISENIGHMLALIKKEHGSSHNIKMEIAARVLAMAVDAERKSAPDRYILHFARDMGFTHIQQQALGALEEREAEKDKSGVLFLNRSMMGSVYNGLKSALQAAKAAGKKDLGEAAAEWFEKKMSEPGETPFKDLYISARDSLDKMGVFQQEEVLLFDTGYYGTMPYYVYGLIRYYEKNIEKRDDGRKLDILLISSTSDARDLQEERLSEEDRELLAASESAQKLLRDNSSFCRLMEKTGDDGQHPVRFLSGMKVWEREDPANLLYYHYWAVVFRNMAVAQYRDELAIREAEEAGLDLQDIKETMMKIMSKGTHGLRVLNDSDLKEIYGVIKGQIHILGDRGIITPTQTLMETRFKEEFEHKLFDKSKNIDIRHLVGELKLALEKGETFDPELFKKKLTAGSGAKYQHDPVLSGANFNIPPGTIWSGDIMAGSFIKEWSNFFTDNKVHKTKIPEKPGSKDPHMHIRDEKSLSVPSEGDGLKSLSLISANPFDNIKFEVVDVRLMKFLQFFYPKIRPVGITGALTFFASIGLVSVLGMTGVMNFDQVMTFFQVSGIIGISMIGIALKFRGYLAEVRQGNIVDRQYRGVDAETDSGLLALALRAYSGFHENDGEDAPIVAVFEDILDLYEDDFSLMIGQRTDMSGSEKVRAINNFNDTGMWFDIKAVRTVNTDRADSPVPSKVLTGKQLYLKSMPDILPGGAFIRNRSYANNALYNAPTNTLFIHRSAAKSTDFGFGLVMAHERGKRKFFQNSLLSKYLGPVTAELFGLASEIGFVVSYIFRRIGRNINSAGRLGGAIISGIAVTAMVIFFDICDIITLPLRSMLRRPDRVRGIFLYVAFLVLWTSPLYSLVRVMGRSFLLRHLSRFVSQIYVGGLFLRMNIANIMARVVRYSAMALWFAITGFSFAYVITVIFLSTFTSVMHKDFPEPEVKQESVVSEELTLNENEYMRVKLQEILSLLDQTESGINAEIEIMDILLELNMNPRISPRIQHLISLVTDVDDLEVEISVVLNQIEERADDGLVYLHSIDLDSVIIFLSIVLEQIGIIDSRITQQDINRFKTNSWNRVKSMVSGIFSRGRTTSSSGMIVSAFLVYILSGLSAAANTLEESAVETAAPAPGLLTELPWNSIVLVFALVLTAGGVIVAAVLAGREKETLKTELADSGDLPVSELIPSDRLLNEALWTEKEKEIFIRDIMTVCKRSCDQISRETQLKYKDYAGAAYDAAAFLSILLPQKLNEMVDLKFDIQESGIFYGLGENNPFGITGPNSEPVVTFFDMPVAKITFISDENVLKVEFLFNETSAEIVRIKMVDRARRNLHVRGLVEERTSGSVFAEMHVDKKLLSGLREKVADRIKRALDDATVTPMTIRDAIDHLVGEDVPFDAPMIIALEKADAEGAELTDDYVDKIVKGLNEDEQTTFAVIIHPGQGTGVPFEGPPHAGKSREEQEQLFKELYKKWQSEHDIQVGRELVRLLSHIHLKDLMMHRMQFIRETSDIFKNLLREAPILYEYLYAEVSAFNEHITWDIAAVQMEQFYRIVGEPLVGEDEEVLEKIKIALRNIKNNAEVVMYIYSPEYSIPKTSMIIHLNNSGELEVMEFDKESKNDDISKEMCAVANLRRAGLIGTGRFIVLDKGDSITATRTGMMPMAPYTVHVHPPYASSKPSQADRDNLIPDDPDGDRKDGYDEEGGTSFSKGPGGSLIGKISGKDGRILTEGFKASELTKDGKKMLSISHDVLEKEVEVGLGKEIENVAAVKKSLTELLRGAKAGYDVSLKRQMEERLSKITLIVALEPHEKVMGFFGKDVLYVNEDLLADDMSLIHELGESLAGEFIDKLKNENPEIVGIESLNMHTYMRGVGKDARSAYSKLEEKYGDAESLIKDINEKMAEEAKEGRMKRSELTSSEKALIRLNYKLRSGRSLTGQTTDRDLELLHGFQDRLDPAGNIRLSKHIRYLLEDMNRGVHNIFIVPEGSIESRSAQQSAGNGGRRKLEREYGINTTVFRFSPGNVMGIKQGIDDAIVKAKEINAAAKREGRRSYPKIFLNCPLSHEDERGIKLLIEDSLKSLPEEIRNMIVVNFEVGVTETAMIDEIKTIMVGSALLNDHRLKFDLRLPIEELKESRYTMIKAFTHSGIIKLTEEDKKNLKTTEGLDEIMQKIYNGILPLRINPINWNELRDFHDSMQLILQSV